MPYDSFKVVIDAQLSAPTPRWPPGVAKKDLYDFLVKDGMAGPPRRLRRPPRRSRRRATSIPATAPGSAPGSQGHHRRMVRFPSAPLRARGADPQTGPGHLQGTTSASLAQRAGSASTRTRCRRQGRHGRGRQGNEKFWKMHGLMFRTRTSCFGGRSTWNGRSRAASTLARWRRTKESPEVAGA